jgi:hypothetical protein
MKKSIRWQVVWMGVILLLAASANAVEEDLALDKVPKPIMEAVQARFNGVAVTEATKETEDGVAVYELSLKVNGQTVEVILSPEGKIRLIEKTIAAKDLPNAVAKSLEENYPKSTHKKITEIIFVEGDKEYPPYYEDELVTARKKNFEVDISADGTVVKESKVSGVEESLTATVDVK